MFRRNLRYLDKSFALIIFVIILYNISKNTESSQKIISFAFIALVIFIVYKIIRRIIFIGYIKKKYQDKELVRRILKHSYWQGQTEEQLKDALGKPVKIDRSVLKTKTKEVWKYKQRTAKRFGLRIVIENGVVIGWEKRT